jgi:NAD(P)-dependent dehydrogenase (short-subunit alcohol dehydrogenase family)
LEKLRQILETNVIGAVKITRAMLPMIRKSPAGRIVNVSSGGGSLGGLLKGENGLFAPAYQISKTALNAFTVLLAIELRDTPIKVNSACPGWVRTDMGGPNATYSPEQGADTPVWLASLPADGPTGGFFNSRKPIPW